MGFFKDFKNDMKQAVNELMPGDEEMVNEYDDDDMVNTLEEEPEDSYVNTMEPVAASASEEPGSDEELSLIHISEPTRLWYPSRMPSSA